MKEDFKPKDGKRKLYFTSDMQYSISYILEPNTTCESIFEIHKNTIYLKLGEIFKDPKIDLNNFDFYLVDLKGIKNSQNNLLTKIKLNRKMLIYNFLQNTKTILCFLQKNIKNSISRIKERNKILDDKINITNDKLLEIKKNYLINKQTDDFFTNKTIFLYNFDTKSYNKLKANLSEKQLTIRSKNEKIILIQDINSLYYCDNKDPMIEPLNVASGYKPQSYIILKTNDEQIIIGLKNEDKRKKWEAGLNFVLANYKTFTNDIDLKININDLKTTLSENEIKIIENTLVHENLLKNKDRKYILFYSLFEDKQIAKLIDDIFTYQNFVKIENF